MEIGSDAYLMEECFDAPLIEKGIQQAKDLGNQWKGLNAVQIVFVSPLTRTLQTCEESFQAHPGVKIIAHDQIKEYPQGCLLYTSPSPREQRASRMTCSD